MAGGSDARVPQVLTPAEAHQGCLSHQALDLTFASETDASDERRWVLDLRHLFEWTTSSDLAQGRPRRSWPRANLLRLRTIGNYLMTSVAWASSDGGMVGPSAWPKATSPACTPPPANCVRGALMWTTVQDAA